MKNLTRVVSVVCTRVAYKIHVQSYVPTANNHIIKSVVCTRVAYKIHVQSYVPIANNHIIKSVICTGVAYKIHLQSYVPIANNHIIKLNMMHFHMLLFSNGPVSGLKIFRISL